MLSNILNDWAILSPAIKELAIIMWIVLKSFFTMPCLPYTIFILICSLLKKKVFR